MRGDFIPIKIWGSYPLNLSGETQRIVKVGRFSTHCMTCDFAFNLFQCERFTLIKAQNCLNF